MYSVFQDGITFRADDSPAEILRKGILEKIFVNVVYEPFRNLENEIIGIIAIASEETEKVKSRHKLLKLYEQERLAKETAELGTFDIDLKLNTLEWDNRCRILFGISHNNELDYEKDFIKGLHPDDKDRILDIIDKCFIKSLTNGIYDVEYRTIGAEDGKLRWILAKGQVLFNSQEEPLRFIGSVLDITERKLNEQRKNDFISMVSHELKTPLTILNAHAQLFSRNIKADNLDKYSIAILKMEKQIKKMSTLVNGFLNLSSLEINKLSLSLKKFSILNY